MKNLTRILFVLCCLSLGNANAFSLNPFAKNMSRQLSTQKVNKPTLKALDYPVKRGSAQESIQVTFSEEPSEFHFRLSESYRQAYLASFSEQDDEEDSDDEDDEVFFAQTDLERLFPKELDLFLTWDSKNDYTECLTAYRFHYTQEEVREALANALTWWQDYCTAMSSPDWGDEFHFTSTPILEDENGHYTTDIFYSCLETFDEDDVEESYSWGRIMITATNIYLVGFSSSKNDEEASTRASEFLSSYTISHS